MNKTLLYVVSTVFFIAYFTCHAAVQESTSLTPYEKTVYYTLVDLYNSGQLNNMVFDERLNVEDLQRILNILKEACRVELSQETRNKAIYAMSSVASAALSMISYFVYCIGSVMPLSVLKATQEEWRQTQKVISLFLCFSSCGFLYSAYAFDRYCGYVGDKKQELLTIDEIKEELDQLAVLKNGQRRKKLLILEGIIKELDKTQGV